MDLNYQSPERCALLVVNIQEGLMRVIGGQTGNTELIIYELPQRAGTPQFK